MSVKRSVLIALALTLVSVATMGQTLRVIRGSKWFQDNVSKQTDAAGVRNAINVYTAPRDAKWVRSTFKPGSTVVVFRQDYSSSLESYWLGVAVSGSSPYFACYELRKLSASGPHALQNAEFRIGTKMLDQLSGMTFSGAGWATNAADSSTYGGSYARTTAANDYVTWTTPSTCTVVGAKINKVVNGGFSKVEIDSDPTKADLCLTAQNYVDLGLLNSSALVADGGTLNPTDRLIDYYANTPLYDVDILLSNSLTVGTHTVKLTNTAYKETASSGARTYITAGFCHTSSGYSLANSDSFLVVDKTNHSVNYMLGSAYEYALQIKPTNAVNFQYAGSIHANETESTFAVKVNGAALSYTNFQKATATTTISAYRYTFLNHPEIGGGTASIANVGCTYSIIPKTGLFVDFAITNLYSGSTKADYVGMFPVNTNLYKCTTLGFNSDVIVGNSDGTQQASSYSDAGYIWEPSGTVGAAMVILDVNRSNQNYVWCDPTFGMFIEDRSGGALKKIYFPLSLQERPHEANSVIYGSTLYLMTIFADANSTLAK